tara:strand:+ start:1387 stop:2355 length:969 start_codon:yes stop_codon:yes gene_type:complete
MDFNIEFNTSKLGFTLNKNTNTPTILKITENGTFHERLLEKSLYETDCIYKVNYLSFNDKYKVNFESISIVNFDPDVAITIIKKYTNAIKENDPLIVRMTKEPIKKLMTNEQVDKQSEIATTEALRNLAKSHKLSNKRNRPEETSSDNNSSDDCDDYVYNKSKIKYLEQKNRNLELDMLNLQIEKEDLTDELKYKLNPISKCNDILCNINFIHARLEKSLCSDFNSKDLNKKTNECGKEYNDYNSELSNYITKIEYNEIKESLIYSVVKNNEKFNLIFKNCYKIIVFKYTYEFIKEICFFFIVIYILHYLAVNPTTSYLFNI